MTFCSNCQTPTTTVPADTTTTIPAATTTTVPTAPTSTVPAPETPKPSKDEKKEYNYLKEGKDWPDSFETCKNGKNQSPVNLVESEAIVTEKL